MIEMVRSLKISHDVVEILKTKDNKIEGYIDTFNNCRETGYVLQVWKYGETELNGNVRIWVHECRNSDNIVIRYGTKYEDADLNNMFSEEVYRNNTKDFNVNEEEKAAEYIIEILEKICHEKKKNQQEVV